MLADYSWMRGRGRNNASFAPDLPVTRPSSASACAIVLIWSDAPGKGDDEVVLGLHCRRCDHAGVKRLPERAGTGQHYFGRVAMAAQLDAPEWIRRLGGRQPAVAQTHDGGLAPRPRVARQSGMAWARRRSAARSRCGARLTHRLVRAPTDLELDLPKRGIAGASVRRRRPQPTPHRCASLSRFPLDIESHPP